MFGPLIVARSTEDGSMHLFLSDQDDQLSFMKSAEVTPAIYKLPECQESPSTHLGAFYATETYMTVEACLGQILIIQSSLKSSLIDDENSWTNYVLKHVLKVSMTFGLLGTGYYQYYKITGDKKLAAAARPTMVSGGHQADEDSVPRRQTRGSARA